MVHKAHVTIFTIIDSISSDIWTLRSFRNIFVDFEPQTQLSLDVIHHTDIILNLLVSTDQIFRSEKSIQNLKSDS